MNAKTDIRLLLALFGVAVIWGTTYLGIRIAVDTIPPWFVTAIRQGLASLILLVFLIRKKELAWLGWAHCKKQIILSVLMIVIANGLTTVAEKNISSGLASLLNALSPLLVFIGSVSIGLQKLSLKGITGVVIGFLGIVFLFRDGLSDLLDPEYKKGILIMGFAVCGWATGTIYIKKNNQEPSNIFLDLFYQFAFSAFAQLILAFIFSGDTKVSSWSIHSLFAAVYLGVFGSVIAFFCYHYALKKVTAVKASILSYFNTVIAIFLGWLILNEVITFDLIIATVLIITGVCITNYNKKIIT